jgi:hypothetical protein
VRRVLVLADESLESGALADVTADAEVFVVAPALCGRLAYWATDDRVARRVAAECLRHSLARLRRDGFRAAGRIGDVDPLLALVDALQTFPADEVVIATRAADRRHWLERNLFERARAYFDGPVHRPAASS